MKRKVLNVLLILTALFGDLEWTRTGYTFLFDAEADLFSRLLVHSHEIVHPISIILLAGHVVLFITLFQKKPGTLLTYTGLGILGLLIGYLFAVGVLALNVRLVLSTIPFLVVAVLTMRHYRESDRENSNPLITGTR